MLYVGIDHHKRSAQVNAIDGKEPHPCFGGPRPNGQAVPKENRRNTGWNPKGKEAQNSKKACPTPDPFNLTIGIKDPSRQPSS